MTTKSKIIPFSILTIGFILGASALSTLAQFTPAPSSPPTCPVEIPGCNPPINTSSTTQSKNGVLRLKAGIEGSNSSGAFGLEVLNGIKLIDGTVGVGAGPNNMVLTADANGVGNWKALPASGSGGAKYKKVSTEVSVQSTNGAGSKTKVIVPATSQWPVCLLTRTQFSGTKAFVNECSIDVSNGNWVLSAYANAGGTESTYCSARCIGYATNPFGATCTTPKANVLIGEQFTWTATPSTPGSYQYMFGKQASPSTDPTENWTHNSSGTDSETVSIYDSTGTNLLGNFTCTNLENNTNTINVLARVAIRDASPSNTSSAACPVRSFSASAPAGERTLLGSYSGGFTQGIQWLNASNIEIGNQSTYILVQTPAESPVTLTYKRRTGTGSFGSATYSSQTCTITIIQ